MAGGAVDSEFNHQEISREFESNGKTIELDDFDILAINSRRKKYLESLLESSSPLLDSLRTDELQFEVGISEARSKVQQLRPLPNKQSCVFCRKNNEEYKTYSTHLVKNRLGEVTCPILKQYRCPYCGATGKHAHTIKYCPKYDGLSTVDALLRTPRNGFGKRKT